MFGRVERVSGERSEQARRMDTFATSMAISRNMERASSREPVSNDSSAVDGDVQSVRRRVKWVMNGWKGVACAVSLLTGAACAPDVTGPNIVIVTLDTTRADHLGLYGYPRDTSPMLDRFAEQAIVFDRAIVPMATTLPTHTSLFTATQPLEHGVLANSTQGGRRFVSAPQLRLFAELARAAGWQTAAFVSGLPLKRGSGLEQGFESFDEPGGKERRAGATTSAAIDWLAAKPRAPFLLWVHYFDAHWPYDPPVPYDTRFTTDATIEAVLSARQVPETVSRPNVDGSELTRHSINRYDGELRYQDEQLGVLLSALAARGDWSRTAVLIMGDHGEGLGQHGEAAHGGIWDEQLHVPLVMRVPGERPRRVTSPIAAVDVIPTLLGRLEAPQLVVLLDQASGQDRLRNETTSQPEILSQDTGRSRGVHEKRSAITTERWKLLHTQRDSGSERVQLYDLRADPYELNDVAGAHPEVVRQLGAARDKSLAAQRQKGAALLAGTAPKITAPDADLLEQLRALGYVEE